MLSPIVSRVARQCTYKFHNLSTRTLSTLSTNKHIYAIPTSPNKYTLTLLPTTPPNQRLSIGTSTTLPPTTDSFEENPAFIHILQEVFRDWARYDPGAKAQAAAFVSTSGSALGSGASLFPGQRKRRQQRGAGNSTSTGGVTGGGGAPGGDGAGGASAQGGAGGGGRIGYIHLSDGRLPPDYGRIAWPEDIFGSLQVGADGSLDGENGVFEWAGSYRVLTREGILGLSDFLREKVIERLKEEEKKG